jgi:hypothetical protein
MELARFWLNYYAGAIKATLILAGVLSIALVGLTNLSLAYSLLTAGAASAVVVGGLERWVNAKNRHPLRTFEDPELGRVSVFRSRWSAQVQAFGLSYPFALVGYSKSGPTQHQVLLWRAIRDRGQPVLDAAYRALAPQLLPGDPQRLSLELMMLGLLDTFELFLVFHASEDPQRRGGFFVRYKAMTVVEAGRTPSRGKWP